MTQLLRPDDPRLTWQGAVSLERTDGWVAPWRIPCEDRVLFPPERLGERLAMPAGVRIVFRSNTTLLAGRLASPHPESSPIDLCCDGVLFGSIPLAGRDAFRFDGLPPGDKLIELWLPQFGTFRLRSLEVSDGATCAPCTDVRPRWITYGSSITQCRAAESPTRTWPAIVSRARGLDLFCLGVGGECHLDTMIARMIRDQPADLISLALGINVMGEASLSPRTFRPAVIGFVQIIREKHPHCPLIVRSPIFSPARETTANAVGFTLQMMRQEVQAAVEALIAHGDCNIHYVDGLEVLGPEFAHLLPDGLHPNADGYKVIGQRFSRVVARILS
ncbi:MAG: GDSL family lipase [Anaerolineae bacterium]|nr:GDSL family lipase [Anaerolineae bacterium]